MEIKEATNHTGKLPLGDLNLDVTILKDGTPVISYNSAERFFGINQYKGKFFPALRGELKQIVGEPLRWQVKGHKRTHVGFEANILYKFAKTIVKMAKFDGEEMTPTKEAMIERGWELVDAFGESGVRAVCYDVAGYLKDIKRNAIVEYFNKFISDFMRPAEKRFASDFFVDLFRVYDKPLPKNGNIFRGAWISKFLDVYVYKVLPEEVMKEIRDRNPYRKGRFRKHRNHQFLSGDLGDPALMAVIQQVRTLLKLTPAGDVDKFKELHRKAFPKNPNQMELHFGVNGLCED